MKLHRKERTKLLSFLKYQKFIDSPFRVTSLIYAEKFEFENPAIKEDKPCKQTERFSVMTKGRDYFLWQDDKSK